MNRKNSVPHRRPPCHIDENAGQRDWKIRAGACIGLDAVGEAGGEDDHAGQQWPQRYPGRRCARPRRRGCDPGSCSCRKISMAAMPRLRVKEGLVHGGGDDVPQARFVRTPSAEWAAGRISCPRRRRAAARLCTASTTIRASRAIIMTLVMLLQAFLQAYSCRPKSPARPR